MTASASIPVLADAASTDLLGTASGNWRLDPASTTIEFHTKAMWGLSKVRGTFAAVSGAGTLGDHNSISGELVIDAASVDTGNRRRDKHLRAAEFFDVSNYPTLAFTATEVAPSADGTLTIKGTLRVRDHSEPVELVAVPTAASPDRLIVTAETTIDRTKWGMRWAKMGAGLINRVVVVAQFVRR